METQHWVGDAADCKYITKEQEKDLIGRLSEIGKMLNSMINKADKFCGAEPDSIREEVADYIISPNTEN